MSVRPMILPLLLLATACPGNAPCSNDCAPMEGVWFLQYVAPTFPCDGGTPAAPPATLSFTREGSVLRSVIDGVPVTGTLYDTSEFSVGGQMPGGGAVISMRGRYQGPSRFDAGDEQLVDGRLSRDTGACSEDRRFTGARY